MSNLQFLDCETELIHRFDDWLNKATSGGSMGGVLDDMDSLRDLHGLAMKRIATPRAKDASQHQAVAICNSVDVLGDAILRSNHIGVMEIIKAALNVRKNLHLSQIEQEYARTG